jgi:hypothetical protein
MWLYCMMLSYLPLTLVDKRSPSVQLQLSDRKDFVLKRVLGLADVGFPMSTDVQHEQSLGSICEVFGSLDVSQPLIIRVFPDRQAILVRIKCEYASTCILEVPYG